MMVKERLRRLQEVMRQHSTSIEIVVMECESGSCKTRRWYTENPAGWWLLTVGAEQVGRGSL